MTAVTLDDRGDLLARFLLGALAIALVVTVLDQLTIPFTGATITLRYKTLWRTLPIVWLVALAWPPARRRLAPRRHPSDLPLALFVAAAALSIALGGRHWGDFRSLVAAIGVGVMARSLFAPMAWRALFVHVIGATFVLVLARELWLHPDIWPPHELGRYSLVTANPNVLGFLFAMTLPVLFAEALAATGDRRALGVLYALVALVGTLLTFSRTAAVGAAAGMAVLALASLPRGRALALLGIAGLAFFVVQRPDEWTKLRTTGDAQRVRILQTSLALAADAPVLGVGFGINNLEDVFPDRYEDRYGERVFRYHSMNQVIDLLVGTGIVGTVFALWWATRVGARALGWFRSAPAGAARIRAAGGLAACVAVALMSMGEPPLYHGKLIPILFLLVALVELGPIPDRD